MFSNEWLSIDTSYSYIKMTHINTSKNVTCSVVVDGPVTNLRLVMHPGHLTCKTTYESLHDEQGKCFSSLKTKSY